MDSLQQFLTAPEVERFEPATIEELDAFQTETGLSLPTSAIRLYRASNGLNIDRLGLRFVPLEEVLKYIVGFQHWGISKRWGYFPCTDANDSNPYCVCCLPPLNGKIVHVFHDDDAALDFRDMESFLDAIIKLVGGEDASIGDLPAQYAAVSDRTPDDVAVGLELLKMANGMTRGDPDRDQSLVFGTRLLSDTNVVEFIRLLDGTPQVREVALKRLVRIPTAEARTAVRAYRYRWDQFRTEAVASLRAAGITVAEVKNDCVLLQPNHVWLDLTAFYEDHREPDVFERLVHRASHFVSQKRP